MSLFYAELAGQEQRLAPGVPAVVLERLEPAGGIDRHRAQQLGQLMSAAGIEGAIGAAGKPGELLEGRGGERFAALVEQEDRETQDAELACHMAEIVGR